MRKNAKAKLNNKGAAMMITIIIIAVVMIFAFSLILISYNLYASQNKNLASTKNDIAANTLSLALKEELTDQDASLNSNIWKYVRMNVAYNNESTDIEWKEWPYYDPKDTGTEHGKEAAFRYFTLDGNSDIEGMPAKISICMYWTLPQGKDASTLASDIASGNINARSKIRLHIITEAQTADQVYRIEDVYRLLISETDQQDKTALLAIAGSDNYNPAGNDYDPKEKWVWIHEERR